MSDGEILGGNIGLYTNKKSAFDMTIFKEGMRDGFPIGLGYFAVAFSLGIAAKKANLTALQGFFASLLNNASAGEYAGFSVIAANGTYIEMAIMIFVANARYILMSCALSQRLAPNTSMLHRILIGYDIADEIFGITIARKGFINPFYTYGAVCVAAPCWATGTALGIMAGNVLPLRVVSALSVALYGMFLAVIIPAAKKEKIIAGLIMISFAASWIAGKLPFISSLTEGTRIIILTVVISAVAAILFPKKEEKENVA